MTIKEIQAKEKQIKCFLAQWSFSHNKLSMNSLNLMTKNGSQKDFIQ